MIVPLPYLLSKAQEGRYGLGYSKPGIATRLKR